MACVTLKRPLEWIDPSMSAESSASAAPGSSSPTSMIISNSPPHSMRSPKRLCLYPMGSNSPNNHYNSFSSNTSSYYHSPSSLQHTPQHNLATNRNSSYFKPISCADIASEIHEEMLRLRFIRTNRNSATLTASPSSSVVGDIAVATNASVNRTATADATTSTSSADIDVATSNRNQSNKNVSGTASGNDEIVGNKSPSPSESSMSSSPSSSPRRNDLDGNENVGSSSTSNDNSSNSASSTSPYNLYTDLIGQQTGSKLLKSSSNTNKVVASETHHETPSASSNNKRARIGSTSLNGQQSSKPLFTFNQVVMIVQRLLREKEDTIRREYEQALTARLAEQYDQFVKFSYDQIQRRFDSQSLPSYLS